MSGAHAPSPTLHDLMAHVGYLLLRWGHLESVFDPASAGFPDELQPIRAMRNTICHGLRAANADPRASHATITCRGGRGADVVYTWADLDDAIRTLERQTPRI